MLPAAFTYVFNYYLFIYPCACVWPLPCFTIWINSLHLVSNFHIQSPGPKPPQPLNSCLLLLHNVSLNSSLTLSLHPSPAYSNPKLLPSILFSRSHFPWFSAVHHFFPGMIFWSWAQTNNPPSPSPPTPLPLSSSSVPFIQESSGRCVEADSSSLAERKWPWPSRRWRRATQSAKDETSLARPASWASLTIPMSFT